MCIRDRSTWGGVFDFEGEEWSEVSLECKELICRMISKDVETRYNSDQALRHTWIRTTAGTSKGTLAPTIFTNMSSFKAMQKLKKAVLMYIATQTADKDVASLRESFISMDQNGDGRISLEELQEAMQKINITGNYKELLESVDFDKSGFVDYTEFLAASLGNGIYLTEEKISTAFSAFDSDKSGKISAAELKSMLGDEISEIDETIWTEMIKEVDTDNDGEISYAEFQKMMGNVRESSKAVTKVKSPINPQSCLLYTSPSPRDLSTSRMPSSA
eukprot:TRINITY_DN20054_c0_g1_i2.p1 TRINITY_DN20054_c0_g1~~TRINITY_DN20054_c0_g1_i2.p1  ORF type:complete len:274 (+),score=52.70 TRINITY_DN20054_c0_g1_i2:162-983(+)